MKEGGRVCCRKNLENLNILITLDEISETAIEPKSREMVTQNTYYLNAQCLILVESKEIFF